MQDNIEFKVLDTFTQSIQDRVVKQIFAVMGNPDEGGDIIHTGAFVKTLAERLDDVQVLWQHDGGAPPIGVPIMLKEIGRTELPRELLAKYPQATGALFGAVEYLDSPRGNEVLTGIQKKAIKKNSIGFRAIKADFETVGEETIRHLREVQLFDVSPVNWSMNPATMNLKATRRRGVSVALLQMRMRLLRLRMPTQKSVSVALLQQRARLLQSQIALHRVR
jgi:HK97 family phage prohead protease